MVEPDYYAKNGLSPLKAYKQGLLSRSEYVGFLKGNIIKYVIRSEDKEDPLLDIVKAMDYLHHLHQVLQEDKKNEYEKLAPLNRDLYQGN